MIIAYIRVSTDKQNLENQKHKILSYAFDKKLTIDEFIEIKIYNFYLLILAVRLTTPL